MDVVEAPAGPAAQRMRMAVVAEELATTELAAAREEDVLQVTFALRACTACYSPLRSHASSSHQSRLRSTFGCSRQSCGLQWVECKFVVCDVSSSGNQMFGMPVFR